MVKLVTLLKAPPTAKRIKMHIPYQNHAARQLVKQELSGYYHPQQKLWSIVNIKENKLQFDYLFRRTIKNAKATLWATVPGLYRSTSTHILVQGVRVRLIQVVKKTLHFMPIYSSLTPKK